LEVSSDQLVIGRCIDRLSWQDLSGLASITEIPAVALQARLAIAQLLTSGCSILLTLHVVNFAHLDRLVP
jgi:hypothetical protein